MKVGMNNASEPCKALQLLSGQFVFVLFAVGPRASLCSCLPSIESAGASQIHIVDCTPTAMSGVHQKVL